MVSGHLQEKNGYYYAVLTYTDDIGKRHQPWIPTNLPVRGNKRAAEEKLVEIRRNFVIPKVKSGYGDLSSDMLFSDYLDIWLEMKKGSVALTTYANYSNLVQNYIGPYFREKKKTLGGVKAVDIQMFYVEEMKHRTQAMVIKEHVVIHSAFQHAVMLDLLDFSPMNKVQRPKKAKYIASYYNDEELAQLFEKTKTHKLGLLIQMTAFYGFRREEIIGLRWDAIDFERDTVTVRHTVTSTQLDGKKVIIQSDKAKTKSSLRTMPLVGQFKERLMALKEQQEVNKRVCGNCYDYKYDGYVFVDEMGKLFEPNWVTETFGRLLKKYGLRQIRFHDLRHSCASLMLANGVPMKQIQEWLGHSDIGTTANIYAHLDYNSKIVSANTLDDVLKIPDFMPKPEWE